MLDAIEQAIDNDALDFLTSIGSDSFEGNVDINNPNIAPYQKPAPKALSFNQPIPELPEEPKPTSNKRRFIIRETFVDKFNKKCSRVLLTPSVCSICAFDVLSTKGLTWNQIPVEERPTVEKAVAEHKRVVHTLGDLHIIDEDQMPKVWLGQHK